MSVYMTLYKFTDQGVKNIKDSPKRLEAAVKVAEAKGVKLLGAYYIFGDYDLIVIADVADEKVGLAHTLETVSMGNVRSKTLRAYTPSEFSEIIQNM